MERCISTVILSRLPQTVPPATVVVYWAAMILWPILPQVAEAAAAVVAAVAVVVMVAFRVALAMKMKEVLVMMAAWMIGRLWLMPWLPLKTSSKSIAQTQDWIHPSEKHGGSTKYGSQLSVKDRPFSGDDISNAKQESGGTAVQKSLIHSQAWRPDDAFRPQSLPNLSKQHSFQLDSERPFGRGGSVWGCKNVGPVPKSCPICYEDLDCTDSSFLPCLCGFRLCLFCHKRILEEDGRCPGCRKQYDCDPVEGEATLDGGSLIFCLARSCSMTTRS
ncbi:UNVERIFIED_CONTAM: hypothetical protein Sradi_0020300 [Sesamum radiatum]|uniref:RING-type domain-containing protein n=1 Tax=Sesamum radiatum TaxID=300843 RepID=A0AAW2WG55_SESRA